MFTKYGTLYDTDTGGEQPGAEAAAQPFPAEPARAVIGHDDANSQRWENDGGSPLCAVFPPAPARPAWSVLSLRHLLHAIQQQKTQEQCDTSRHARDALLRDADRREQHAATIVDDRRDRYRNAWEHADDPGPH